MMKHKTIYFMPTVFLVSILLMQSDTENKQTQVYPVFTLRHNAYIPQNYSSSFKKSFIIQVSSKQIIWLDEQHSMNADRVQQHRHF